MRCGLTNTFSTQQREREFNILVRIQALLRPIDLTDKVMSYYYSYCTRIAPPQYRVFAETPTIRDVPRALCIECQNTKRRDERTGRSILVRSTTFIQPPHTYRLQVRLVHFLSLQQLPLALLGRLVVKTGVDEALAIVDNFRLDTRNLCAQVSQSKSGRMAKNAAPGECKRTKLEA